MTEDKTMNETRFALRLPLEMKVAANALSNVWFRQWEVGDDGEEYRMSWFHLRTTNNALVYLLRHGLMEAIAIVEQELEEEEFRYQGCQALMAILDANPDTDSTLSHHRFFTTSEKRVLLGAMTEENKNDKIFVNTNATE